MTDETNNKSQELNEQLLVQFTEQRSALIQMISDLERIKAKVETLFPEQLDNRQVYRFQEKVKAVTELFKSMLDVRKEIMKSIKDEVELRKKLSGKDEDEEDILNDTDIKKLANRIESMIEKPKQKSLKIVNQSEESMEA